MNANNSSPTFYDILGVERDADAKSIRKAYLQKSLEHHPDKNPHNVEQAKAKFVQVGQAYECLSDLVKRQQYDQELLRDNGATLRQRWKAAAAASSSASSPHANSAAHSEANNAYESYQSKFDAFVGGLSEEELRAAAGIASVIGSVVGSIVGAKLGKNAGSIVGNGASIVGSIVGSKAGVGIVKTMHEQSVDRLTWEERRREAVARGEAVPDPPPSKNAWDNLRKSVAGAAAEVKSGGNHSSSGNQSAVRWKETVGAAANVAGAFMAMSRAKNSSRHGGR